MMSTNDSAVLSQLFDPESTPSSGVLVDTSLPSDPAIADWKTLMTIKAEEQRIIRDVESVMKDPQASQLKTSVLSAALQNLDTLLAGYPNSASLLNDHAQVFRLLYGNDIIVSSKNRPLSSEVTAGASKVLKGLDTAIRLMSPPTPQSAVSPAQCRTLAQAHTQRGALYYAAAKTLSSKIDTSSIEIMIESLQTWDKIEFEEAASRDFFMGGRYGNEVGKALAVHTNPTARLCGQIVQDAMRREMAPSAES